MNTDGYKQIIDHIYNLPEEERKKLILENNMYLAPDSTIPFKFLDEPDKIKVNFRFGSRSCLGGKFKKFRIRWNNSRLR